VSIFQDNTDVYTADGTWHSSPWQPFYHKMVSRYIDEAEGDSLQLKMWCCEPEWEGTELHITASHDTTTGGDVLTKVSYPGDTVDNAETDDYKFGEQDSGKLTSEEAHDDRTVKHWFAPGVALQLPNGTHATNTITQETKWSYTPTSSDIGGKVFDGGVHCWMKFPYNTVASSSTAAQTYVYSKPFPMEYVGNSDILLVWNSLGHQVRREKNTLGTNTAINLEREISYVDNPGSSDWFSAGTVGSGDAGVIMDDVDVEDFTGDGKDGVNENFMLSNLIAEMEGVKNLRLKMYVDDGEFTEARQLRSQFIRVSLYPINKR
jgi:hypothetical protein